MNQLTRDSSGANTMPRIMSALRACYGSLEAPDFQKVHETIRGDSYRALINSLQAEGVEMMETTDENDDVSVQLVVGNADDQVILGLSGIGPFATVIHRSANGQCHWITRPNDAPTPLAAAVATIVKNAGFDMVDRVTMTRTIKMQRADGSTKTTLYQALFTDSDRIP